MSTRFTMQVEGEGVEIRLFSLDEYETAGGVYSDVGNDGDHVSEFTGAFEMIESDLVWNFRKGSYTVVAEPRTITGHAPLSLLTKEQYRALIHEANVTAGHEVFLGAAMISPNETGLPDNDVLEMAGLEQDQYWTDSVTGYFLLRQWPGTAPIYARLVEGDDPYEAFSR